MVASLLLDVPPAEKLLSRRSRASPGPDEGGPDPAGSSPVPRERGAVAQLHGQIAELTSQNSELLLKVQVTSKTQTTAVFPPHTNTRLYI